MDNRAGCTGNRIALRAYGEAIAALMSGAPDARWAEWPKTPFEYAAERGGIELTTVLMKAGARGNALIPAVMRGHQTLVRNLLEIGASTSEKDENDDTPLHLAVKYG